MMLLMLAPTPQPTVLKDEAVVQHVALSSDMVVNFSYTVSGGSRGGRHGLRPRPLLRRPRSQRSWHHWKLHVVGHDTRGLLVKIAHNGTVMGTAHAPYRPLKLVVSDDFAVMIGDHPSTGLFLEAFKPDMDLRPTVPVFGGLQRR